MKRTNFKFGSLGGHETSRNKEVNLNTCDIISQTT